MSANVPIYVRVAVKAEKWIRLSEVVAQDAIDKAGQMPDVIAVLETSYEEPEAEIEDRRDW